jgi:two-component sensor histidine kinase
VAASRANERGRIEWVVGATHDITEQKKAEEQIHFLMNEVTHRSKNLLDVVKSIALLSARQGDPVTFVADLVRRIVGLSACQDILICDKWRGVEVGDLVRAELAPFHDLGDRRLLIAGPRLRLSSKAAQGVGMALHELATNAAKYGALSNTAGCVRVDWSVAEGGETPTFVMHWREEGGPRVAPPTRKGFGQSVIVSMMELAVQGKVDVEYRETGVCWELTSPVCFTLEAA